jgi:hypothetical protein
VPLYPAGDGWLTARGAALLAAAATGLVPDASTVVRSDQNAEAILPASHLAEPGYRRYQPRPTKTADHPVSCFVVSEGSKLRRVFYARMEEMSFRSGAAVAAAVLALTGLGIALTVTLGGGHRAAAAPRVVSVSTTATSAAPLPSASAVPSPSASPSAIQDAPEPMPAAQDAPQSETTRAPSPKASLATSSPWPTPRPIRSRPSYAPSSPGTGEFPPSPPPGWWWPGAP